VQRQKLLKRSEGHRTWHRPPRSVAIDPEPKSRLISQLRSIKAWRLSA